MINNFKTFLEDEDMKESYHNRYYRRDNKFLNWIERLDNSLKNSSRLQKTNLGGIETNDDTRESIEKFLGASVRLVTKPLSTISNFLLNPSNKNIIGAERESRKKYLFNKWEKENLEGKKVTKKDAEDFYTSEVLKGTKFFGNDYQPDKYRNDKEREYNEYLRKAMYKYYNHIDDKINENKINKILDFESFTGLFEGGSALLDTRRIREDEFQGTISDIKEKLFPILNIGKIEDNDYIIIGSIGKKENNSDTSGDLDIGYNLNKLFDKYKLNNIDDLLNILKNKIESNFKNINLNYLKSLDIISISWPIMGDINKGNVQVDLIPIENLKWAKFIYYSPNYKRHESKYKSAHRNWLFSAILKNRLNVLSYDKNGEILDFDSPTLILNSGLYWHKKTHKGAKINRLKKAQKIKGSERFITNDPQRFIDFVFGKGYKEDDVRTFEQVFDIISDKKSELYPFLDNIKKQYIEYLNRCDLIIPDELNKITNK